MDVLDSSPAPLRRSPAAVAAALALLALAQTGALLRTPGLPDDVGLRAESFGYGFDVEGDRVSVAFHLTNRGERGLRVLAVGRDGPGLELVDVEASGEPLGFRSAGAGEEGMPAFDLPPDGTAVLRLVYLVPSCADVPEEPFPVTLRVQEARAEDVVVVDLPRLPDDAADAGPEDEVEWQQVLARGVCGTA